MSATPFHRPRVTTITAPNVSHLAKLFTYATSLAGVYLSVGFMYYYAAKEKLIDQSGTMPTGLKHEFAGSFLASFPGDNVSWVLLGALEALIVVLLAVSVVGGEFLTSRRKPFLLAGLGVSMFALGMMGLANNMVGDTATALTVFTYFGLTAVLLVLIRQLPPYRSIGWISGAGDK
ncbi:MAG TPA: hypothetical protein VFW09_04515 [Solirubrobacteraceae bacterium]|nr:hypothetical protein [Solirubrobacteraceae bacterium]